MSKKYNIIMQGKEAYIREANPYIYAHTKLARKSFDENYEDYPLILITNPEHLNNRTELVEGVDFDLEYQYNTKIMGWCDCKEKDYNRLLEVAHKEGIITQCRIVAILKVLAPAPSVKEETAEENKVCYDILKSIDTPYTHFANEASFDHECIDMSVDDAILAMKEYATIKTTASLQSVKDIIEGLEMFSPDEKYYKERLLDQLNKL